MANTETKLDSKNRVNDTLTLERNKEYTPIYFAILFLHCSRCIEFHNRLHTNTCSNVFLECCKGSKIPLDSKTQSTLKGVK